MILWVNILAGSLLLAMPMLSPAEAVTGIRLQKGRNADPVMLAAYAQDGLSYVVLRTAVQTLEGSSVWHPGPLKVTVKAGIDREIVLAINQPRAILSDGKILRLPHLPRMIRGRVVVTPETLACLWAKLTEVPMTYLAEERLLVFGMAHPPAQDKPPAENAAPAPVAAPSLPATATAAGDPVEQPKSPPNPLPSQAQAKKINLKIVVDAGHGGKDPGAIGPSGLKEKDVTLLTARELAKALVALGCQVVMTRNSDEFISLQRRAEIANQSKADLFVSIHANASHNKKASGSQVFIYNREASSRNAAEAARLENQDANYLEIIKDDLRQSIHEESSITAAGLISQQYEKQRMNVHRIERAPFFVLAKSHMPSVLVETAFISNHQEERKLRTPAFCRDLAQGLVHGVQQYAVEAARIR